MVTKKPKYIDLNKYNVCKKEEADLIIRSKNPDDSSPLFLFFKKIEVEQDQVVDVSGVEWKKNSYISIDGSFEEYGERVDWYYDNIDKEFIEELQTIIKAAIDTGFDLDLSLNKSRRELKIRRPEQRKSNMYRYVIDWVINGCSWWLRKKQTEEMYTQTKGE